MRCADPARVLTREKLRNRCAQGAAETGAADTGQPPLGLILTPADGGAQGVESRWHMAPAHTPDTEAWTLTRLRARTDPVKRWRVTDLAGKPRLTTPDSIPNIPA